MKNVKQVISPHELIEHVLCNEKSGESKAQLTSTGAINILTGTRTGRSREDRYLVTERYYNEVDWGPVNRHFEPGKFEELWQRAIQHAEALPDPLFEQHLRAGADPRHSVRLRVYTKYASHALFAHSMFVRDAGTADMPEVTVLSLPSFHTDPVRDGTNSDCGVFLDLDQRRILVAGLLYSGEMKKAVFTYMNFIMPEQGVLSMHCSANVGDDGESALFFGLSGTGKTTLASDPRRGIIGDDEHVWSDHGISNIEGGCYAKVIQLTEEREPLIWAAIGYGAVMENVVLDPRRRPVYDDGSITENTRVAYPREFISNRDRQNRAGAPAAIIFLTCDAYGVLPPVAPLSIEQAVYHYLSGYTAQVGSTVVGAESPITPKFSAYFGADFFPRRPEVYAKLFEEKLRRYNTPVYLVNTGWTGGSFGHEEGRRYSIATSRIIVHEALKHRVNDAPKWHMEALNLDVPYHLHGVDPRHFTPRSMWEDKAAYDRTLQQLVDGFHANWEKKFSTVDASIRQAGPP